VRGLAVALAAFAIGGAHAQILDSVEVSAEGGNAVVRIRFNVLIQYLRHVPANRGQTIQAFFQITASDEDRGDDRRGGAAAAADRPGPAPARGLPVAGADDAAAHRHPVREPGRFPAAPRGQPPRSCS
jgi:hypothetical protein